MNSYLMHIPLHCKMKTAEPGAYPGIRIYARAYTRSGKVLCKTFKYAIKSESEKRHAYFLVLKRYKACNLYKIKCTNKQTCIDAEL